MGIVHLRCRGACGDSWLVFSDLLRIPISILIIIYSLFNWHMTSCLASSLPTLSTPLSVSACGIWPRRFLQLYRWARENICGAYLLLLTPGVLRRRRRRCGWRSWWWCRWRTHTLVSCRKRRVSGYCPDDCTIITYLCIRSILMTFARHLTVQS